MSKDRGWDYLNSSGEDFDYDKDNDGSWGYENDDGSGSFYGADGSWGYKNSDGSASYYGADGSWGYKNADGSGSYYGNDGSWGYTNQDGSGTYYDENGDAEYSSSDDDDNETELVRRFYVDRYTPRYFEAILESDATYHVRAVCEPEEAGTVIGCVEAAHYEDSVELDVTPAAGWKIVGWSDDPHFDGGHRDIDVYEELDLVVYLEEIEPEGE